MKKQILLFVLAFFFVLPIFAQDVTLYTECNYGGQRATLTAGNYSSSYYMKIPNDRLSSIQISYGMKVTIYEHENYQGRSFTITSSTSCLDAGWRNFASSLVVERDNSQPVYNQNDYITFYNDCYQRGYSQTLRPGTYTGAQLGSLRYNISSFMISGNVKVRLFTNNENASGYSTEYTTSSNCLPNNLNDKIGSLIIETKPNTGGYDNTGGGYGNERYATFYSACDYQGNALRLMPGSYTGAKLGLMKSAIESVQVPSGMRVKAFTSSESMFGSYTYITQDASCLDYNLKDRITSLVVEDQGGGGIYDPNNNNNNPNESVMIYVDDSYRGQSVTLSVGSYSTMAQAGNFPDNAISSVYVPQGYRVVLYEYENFAGKSLTLTSSRVNFFLTSWNDKTSSIIVYKDR